VPPLDPDFRPAALANRAFRKEVEDSGDGVPLVLGLERPDGAVSRFETRVFPEGHPRSEANLRYAERIFKFLLWQRGGWRTYVGGPESIGDYIRTCYSPGGIRAFDYHFMGEDVYDRAFTVVPCAPSAVPAEREGGKPLGRHLDGCRAKYLWGSTNRLPVALAAPSLFSIYDRPPELRHALVVGISQSGQSPDSVSVVAEGGRQGALTVAITNDPGSPLAQAAEFAVDICAGPEKAVAATKTYTAQLMAIAMLSAALSGQGGRLAELQRVPTLVQQALELDSAIGQAAERYRYMEQCVVLGRGYNYATAFEWSLKLKELAYVVAEPYSPADLQHGPVAILSQGFPVLAAVPGGAVFGNVLALFPSWWMCTRQSCWFCPMRRGHWPWPVHPFVYRRGCPNG